MNEILNQINKLIIDAGYNLDDVHTIGFMNARLQDHAHIVVVLTTIVAPCINNLRKMGLIYGNFTAQKTWLKKDYNEISSTHRF